MNKDTFATDVRYLIECIKELDKPDEHTQLEEAYKDILERHIFYYNKAKYQVIKESVIPQFVADYIEKWKHGGLTIYQWFSFDNNDVDEDVNKWLYDNSMEENRRREYLLVNAIRNGYEVEKEKLYRVRAGKSYVRFNLDGSVIGAKAVNSVVTLDRLSKLPFDYKKAVESGIIRLEEVTE